VQIDQRAQKAAQPFLLAQGARERRDLVDVSIEIRAKGFAADLKKRVRHDARVPIEADLASRSSPRIGLASAPHAAHPKLRIRRRRHPSAVAYRSSSAQATGAKRAAKWRRAGFPDDAASLSRPMRRPPRRS